MKLEHLQADADVLRLYFFPGTRAVRARWMLEELGIPYDLNLVDLRQNAHKSDDYLAVHPLGKVPALRIDGTVLFESLAICLYLADRYWESDLAPVHEERIRRADYYRWMAFSTGTLEPAILEQTRLLKGKIAGVQTIDLGPALTPFETAASFVDQTLEREPYLMGDQFNAADLMNGAVMMGAGRADLLDPYKNIKAWIDRLVARPAYQCASNHALGGSK